MFKYKSFFYSALSAAMLFIGCGSDSSVSTNTQNGTFKMHLTDAPGDYEAVNVTFAEISANIDGEWITVQSNAQTVNLLEWNNGKSMVLGEADIPAGQYSQVRLIIDNATVVKDGQTHTLDVPSGAQSGLKLNTNFEVVSGSTYELLLDFDANRSVVETGASNKFILKPTIRTAPLAITGSISGTVSSTANVPVALALSGSDTVTTTVVDTTSGEFQLAFLPPGNYTVVVEDTTGATTTNGSVTVSTGTDLDLGTLNLQVGVVSQ